MRWRQQAFSLSRASQNDGNDGGHLVSTDGDVMTRALKRHRDACTWQQCHQDTSPTAISFRQ